MQIGFRAEPERCATAVFPPAALLQATSPGCTEAPAAALFSVFCFYSAVSAHTLQKLSPHIYSLLKTRNLQLLPPALLEGPGQVDVSRAFLFFQDKKAINIAAAFKSSVSRSERSSHPRGESDCSSFALQAESPNKAHF